MDGLAAIVKVSNQMDIAMPPKWYDCNNARRVNLADCKKQGLKKPIIALERRVAAVWSLAKW